MTDVFDLVARAFPPGAVRLGFGTGDLHAGARAAESARLVETALDAGFRYFDTARLYGDGGAEAVLGDVLSRRRDEVVLVSKAGILPWSMQLPRRIRTKAATLVRKLPLAKAIVPEPAPAWALFGAFRRDQLKRSVETSLKLLKTDRIDLLLLHEPALGDVRAPETTGYLDEPVREGKILAHGVAPTVEQTLAILADRTGPTPRILQAAADVVNGQRRRYSVGDDVLLVTHSSLKPVLAVLQLRQKEDPAFGARVRERTGVDPSDTSAFVPLLLAQALRDNRRGMVLFSTLKPERLAPLRRALEAGYEDAQLDGLEAALGGLKPA